MHREVISRIARTGSIRSCQRAGPGIESLPSRINLAHVFLSCLVPSHKSVPTVRRDIDCLMGLIHRPSVLRVFPMRRRHPYAAGLMMLLLMAPSILATPGVAKSLLGGPDPSSPRSPLSEEETSEEARHCESAGSVLICRRRRTPRNGLLPIDAQSDGRARKFDEAPFSPPCERTALNGCGAILRC